MNVDRIVVGAGIAGLLSAKRAVERGESVLVLSEDIGGLINSVEMTPHIPFRIDNGAEAYSTVTKEVIELIEELGLSDHIVHPSDESARIIDQRNRYRIPRGIMGIPANLEDPELREIFSEAEIAHAKVSDQKPFGDYESVADLIRARLGEAFLVKLVNPVFSGVHGSSAENLSAQAALNAILSKAKKLGSLTLAVAETKTAARPGASVASLRGGMSLITKTLRENLEKSGVQFLLEAALSISNSAQGWETKTATDSFLTPKISICTPVEFLARQVSGIEKVSIAAEKIVTVDVALVVLLVRSKQLSAHPLGTGALITERTNFATKATTHINAKWEWIENLLEPDLHVLRISFGRNGLLPKGDLVELAKSEISEIYGISDAEMIEHRLVYWPNALVQTNHETRSNLEAEIGAHRLVGLEVCGGYLTGNGILGIVKDHNQRKAA